MKYVVDYGRTYEEFPTYAEAELFCGVTGIHCEHIYEEEGECEEN